MNGADAADAVWEAGYAGLPATAPATINLLLIRNPNNTVNHDTEMFFSITLNSPEEVGMTILEQEVRRTKVQIAHMPRRFWWVLALSVLLLILSGNDAALRAIVLTTLSDAFLQVSAFVALTLGLLFVLERMGNFDTLAVMEKHRDYQVPLAALLGAIPGCGGAIVVATQYASGRLSFGALLAALTATMGDAAFLLLAQEPMTGLGVFALGAFVGGGDRHDCECAAWGKFLASGARYHG